MMLFNERPGIVLRYLALCPLRGCDGPCWGSIPANFARVYGFTDSRRDGPNQREGDAGISESKRGRFAVPAYFALITRALIVLEGIALTGDRDFDIFRASYPFAIEHAARTLGMREISAVLDRG